MGNERAREYVVRKAGVRIVAHTLDLNAEPAALVGAVSSLAEGMVACVSSDTPG